MQQTQSGGCLCGAIRYRTIGTPKRTTVCHCTFCQRLTGSAFAVWSAFETHNVGFEGEARSSYEHRSDESGRWLRLEFCPRCGTTIGSTFERGVGLYDIAAGTYDDTSWIAVDRHVWTRSAQHWIEIPPGAVRFEKEPR